MFAFYVYLHIDTDARYWILDELKQTSLQLPNRGSGIEDLIEFWTRILNALQGLFLRSQSRKKIRASVFKAYVFFKNLNM